MALRITRNGHQLCDLISLIYQYSVSQGKLIIFWSCHLILIVNFPVQKKMRMVSLISYVCIERICNKIIVIWTYSTTACFPVYWFHPSLFTTNILLYFGQLSEWYCKNFLTEKAYFFWYFNTQVSYKLDSSSGTPRNHKTGQP